MGEGTPLKPCPFCASRRVDAEGWASTNRAGPACDNCGASADSVAAWNDRPPLYDAAPAMYEALKEARDLLLERTQGSPARSAAHNARLVIEAALSSAESRASLKEDGNAK